MRSDVLVYLAGPITPKNGYTMQQNAEAALEVYLRLLKLGIPCFLPHLNCFIPNLETCGVEYKTWTEYDFAVMWKCSHILMLPRWRDSAGAIAERNYAIEHGMDVYYTEESLLSSLGFAPPPSPLRLS